MRVGLLAEIGVGLPVKRRERERSEFPKLSGDENFDEFFEKTLSPL